MKKNIENIIGFNILQIGILILAILSAILIAVFSVNASEWIILLVIIHVVLVLSTIKILIIYIKNAVRESVDKIIILLSITLWLINAIIAIRHVTIVWNW